MDESKEVTFRSLMAGSVFSKHYNKDIKKLAEKSTSGDPCPRCGLPRNNAVDWGGYLAHICADEIVTIKPVN